MALVAPATANLINMKERSALKAHSRPNSMTPPTGAQVKTYPVMLIGRIIAEKRWLGSGVEYHDIHISIIIEIIESSSPTAV